MIIVIDGYNLLKQVFPGSKTTLERQRNAFVQQLAYYKSKKAKEIQEIVVVFDAGPSQHATRETKSGIVVVFSGVKSSADNWIVNFIQRNKGKEMLVITLDREIRDACKKEKVDTLGVFEFYKLLQSNIVLDAQDAFVAPEDALTELEKYEPADFDMPEAAQPNNKALDLLMEQATVRMEVEKDDDKEGAADQVRASKGHALSKKEKRMIGKIKKLA